ncbi:TBC domain protein [Ichthyophthirius multifiliis]|uniref:TBC domain protein n=1 Tax=Ichthyophthirius multifiliis TaxID=5932 RepID=G0QKF5_ICHMU|nr:TBC domain protein [Ichthyophthirius multifiliis]EGR34296.1 TBC domain protein [Ichthyophthirius multifiliis]|eukprot:XP_004039600.1 TBC domain protein [Ichthyophthirius multifiliis]
MKDKVFNSDQLVIKKQNKSQEKKIFKNKENKKEQQKTEKSLVKINIHKVYNKYEDYKPIGASSQYQANYQQEDLLYTQFGKMLNENQIDYIKLKTKSWNGIPQAYRGVVWKIIIDYQLTNRKQAEAQLKRLREEYNQYVNYYFKNELVRQNFTIQEQKMIKVIEADVPRTQPQQQNLQIAFNIGNVDQDFNNMGFKTSCMRICIGYE